MTGPAVLPIIGAELPIWLTQVKGRLGAEFSRLIAEDFRELPHHRALGHKSRLTVFRLLVEVGAHRHAFPVRTYNDGRIP